MQTAEGKLYLFVTIDRTSKFAFTRLVEKDLIAAVPYRLHTVLAYRQRGTDLEGWKRELERPDRELGKLLTALKAGVPLPSIIEDMKKLEARKAERRTQTAAPSQPRPSDPWSSR